MTSVLERRVSSGSPAPARVGMPVVLMAAAAALVGLAQLLIAAKLVTIVGFLGAGDARPALLGYAAMVSLLAALALLGNDRSRQLALGLAAGGPLLVLGLTAVAGQAWALLVTLLLVLAMWRIGRAGLDLLSLRLHPLCAGVIGLVAVGTLVQLLGRIGALRWWSVTLPVLLVGAVAAFELGRAALPRLRERPRPHVVAPGVLATVVGMLLLVQLAWALIYAAAPDAQYDAIYAKAWLPEQWALSGRIETLTEHPLLANIGLSQLVATVGWLAGVESIGRYLQVAAGVAVVATVLTWPDRRPGPVALLAAAAFGLMPHVLWQTGTAYDDLILSAVCLGAVVGVWTLLKLGATGWRAAVAVGVLSGTVLATKLHLLVFAAVLALTWALAAAESGAQRLRQVAVTAGAAALAAAAGPLFRYLDTGNPVFPQFNAFFRSEFFPPVNTTLNFPYAAGGPLQLLRLPYDAAVEPAIYTEAVPPGSFGFSLVLVVGALLLCWRAGRTGVVAGLALLVTLAVWWLQFRYLRYLLPYVAVSAGIVVASLAPQGTEQRWPLLRQRLLAGGVVIVAVATFAASLASFWNIPGRVPADVAFGQLSPAAYERMVVPGYGVVQDLNRLAESGAVVTGDLYARTALRPDLDYSPTWELAQRAELAGFRTGTTTELLRAYMRLGVRWVGVRTEMRLAAGEADPLIQLLREHGEPLSVGGGFELYRLVGDPADWRAYSPLCNTALINTSSIGPAAPTCWDVPLDAEPGVTPSEVSGGITQAVPVCAGDVYAIDAVGAPGSTVTLSFTGDVGLERYVSAAIPADGTARVIAGPIGEPSTLIVHVVPVGEGVDTVSAQVLGDGVGC